MTSTQPMDRMTKMAFTLFLSRVDRELGANLRQSKRGRSIDTFQIEFFSIGRLQRKMYATKASKQEREGSYRNSFLEGFRSVTVDGNSHEEFFVEFFVEQHVCFVTGDISTILHIRTTSFVRSRTSGF